MLASRCSSSGEADGNDRYRKFFGQPSLSSSLAASACSYVLT